MLMLEKHFVRSKATLTQRNLMCLRALVNLAIALGPVLEEGWKIVLECLQKAHVLLALSGTAAVANDYRLSTQASEKTPSEALPQSSLSQEIAAVDAKLDTMSFDVFGGHSAK